MENLSLRGANIDDEAFLGDLFFDVRSDEFALAGLSLEQLKPLMAMQYATQKQSYQWTFPNAEQSIIEFEGERIGRLLITRNDGKVHLIDISILRGFRGKRIGSAVLKRLKSEAEMIILRVFKTNFGVINLYERHEFITVCEDGEYVEMEWKNA
ncbi:hypothetical protein BH10ACI1_BH10ACI1_27550 [soil metagenome]